MQTQCSFCGADYAALQRTNQLGIVACLKCDQEYCEKCVEHEEIGQFLWIVRCPKCGENELSHSKLTARFTIFSDLQKLGRSPHAIVLPAESKVAWSNDSLRAEALVNKALPKLKVFEPELLLLNKDDPAICRLLVNWFPQSFCNEPTVEAGTLIWTKRGKPFAILPGSPYLTEYEILKMSRSVWT